MARTETPPATTPADEERAPTKRVVLKREQAIIVPEGADPEKVKQAIKLVGSTRGTVKDVWWVVGEFEGHSKVAAIEGYAGKPGTPDAKPGAYKAPGASAFAGGLLYEKPPEPKVERKALT